MKQTFYFLLLAVSLVIYSCSSDGGSKANMVQTKSGYNYVHHVKNDGPKPQEGDEVIYNTAIYKNDSLLFTSFDKPTPQRVVIPSMNQFQGNVPPPDFEGIMLMSPGDSITMYQALDTFSQLPPGYANTDEIIYQIKLNGIVSREERLEKELVLKGQENTIGEKAKQITSDYTSGKLDGQIKTTDSGLKYIIHEEGTGEQARSR